MQRGAIRRRLSAIYELETGHAQRLLAMEGIRGFAVALVFMVHYSTLFSPWAQQGSATTSIAHFLWSIGHSGVDLFFVLSGYLIYGAALRPALNFIKFMQRRIQRIYPTFLCVFAMYLALSFLFPGESKLPPTALSAGVYVTQNLLLLPGIFPIEPIMTVAWSLSYELFYYLTLPLLIIGLRMTRWTPRQRVGCFVLLGLALIGFSFLVSAAYLRMLMFISGIVVYEAIHSFNAWPSLKRGGEAAVLLLFGLTFPLIYLLESHAGLFPSWLGVADNKGSYRIIVLAVSFAIFVLAAFRSRGLLKRLFSWTPLRWLGNMSYSYYLIHGLVLKFAALILKAVVAQDGTKTALFWLALPVAFIGTLVGATLLFTIVEKPLSLVPRRKPAEVPVTTSGIA
jgi:peptidoglycan/LPS O-acetylase OafA/YrhL